MKNSLNLGHCISRITSSHVRTYVRQRYATYEIHSHLTYLYLALIYSFCFPYYRWVLNEDTGNLIAYQLRRQDEGMYRCIAENAAGRIEAESYLDVVIRPKVQELFNKTFPINHPEGRIVCKASGDPLPDIIWRKWSRK